MWVFLKIDGLVEDMVLPVFWIVTWAVAGKLSHLSTKEFKLFDEAEYCQMLLQPSSDSERHLLTTSA